MKRIVLELERYLRESDFKKAYLDSRARDVQKNEEYIEIYPPSNYDTDHITTSIAAFFAKRKLEIEITHGTITVRKDKKQVYRVIITVSAATSRITSISIFHFGSETDPHITFVDIMQHGLQE